jgi:hypothetical protein
VASLRVGDKVRQKIVRYEEQRIVSGIQDTYGALFGELGYDRVIANPKRNVSAGFSQDNKPNQPQVLFAPMVTEEGLPLDYEVFAGNILDKVKKLDTAFPLD